MIAVTDLKRAQRATWASGDHAAVAALTNEAPARDLLALLDLAPVRGRVPYTADYHFWKQTGR